MDVMHIFACLSSSSLSYAELCHMLFEKTQNVVFLFFEK